MGGGGRGGGGGLQNGSWGGASKGLPLQKKAGGAVKDLAILTISWL